MEWKFVVDTQLPPSLAEFLRRRDLNATHVTDYPSGAFTSDKEIIRIAAEEQRIVISKDRDFLDYFLLKGFPPAVLLFQIGNCKNSELFSLLDNQLNTILLQFTEDPKRLIILQRDRMIFF